MSSPYVRFAVPGAIVGLALYLLFDSGPQVDWLVAWIAACSIVTLLLYGIDKAAARTGRTRVPESVLHAFAIAGGFAGGWLGRALFHHKTRHRSFAVVLALSTACWVAAAVWWYWLR